MKCCLASVPEPVPVTCRNDHRLSDCHWRMFVADPDLSATLKYSQDLFHRMQMGGCAAARITPLLTHA